jgi:GGDEF domain-containing protein
VGGDEFVLLAVGAPEPTAPVLLARLEEGVEGFNARGRPYRLSLTVGLAHAEPEQASAFDDLLARAEGDLRARREGRTVTALA